MLTVVIPTYNAEQSLPRLIAQLAEHADDVVVSDGGSTDDTIRLALRANARLAIGCKGRGWQLARGARWAQGDWLLFLHADVKLGSNWVEAVKNHVHNHPDKAAYFKFKADETGLAARLMEGLVRLRTIFSWLPYGDQGLLISKAMYEEVGGHPDWSLFEDVDIINRVRGHAWLWPQKRLRALPASIYTDGAKYKRDGYVKRGLRNLGLSIKFLRGADPEDLAKRYK